MIIALGQLLIMLCSPARPRSANAIIRLDFTGDFGHEVGTLKIAANAGGLIQRIDADLE
nr:hypothetical protein [Rhizobium leguminosarum]